MNDTTKLLKSLRPVAQKQTPIATEMFIPNLSGDHSAGHTRTPTTDLDIANKAYVDTQVAAVPTHTQNTDTGTNAATFTINALDINGNIDVTTQATTITIKDNDASAFVITEGANAYMTFTTTNGSEEINFDKATDFQTNAMRNVNIDSGAIDNTSIGATTAYTIKCTTFESLSDVTRPKDHTGFICPIGSILMWGAANAPDGWLICDGAAVSRTVTYDHLYAVIGTNFGAGDGANTFNLPNFKSRSPYGFDAGNTKCDAIAETGGEETHQLTTAELASHNHTQDSHNHTQNEHTHQYNQGTGSIAVSAYVAPISTSSTMRNLTNTTATNQAATATNQASGSDTAHNTLHPFLTVKFIIKY